MSLNVCADIIADLPINYNSSSTRIRAKMRARLPSIFAKLHNIRFLVSIEYIHSSYSHNPSLPLNA